MRTKLFALAGAAALAVTGLMGAVAFTQAEAQSARSAPVILTMNSARVLSTSKAGQSMKPQLEKLGKEAQSELEAEVAKLTKEAEDLKKQRELLAEDVWTKRYQQVAIKQQQLPTLQEVKRQELALSEQKAVNEITDAMRPILKKIVDDNGATLLLESSAVMYAAQETDISEQVIAELDKKLKSVKVEKISLAELQRQQQAALKKAQEGKGKKGKKKK
ncbi:MAG: OmpH family outer membrane protein [Pseudomonadota bacterium]